MDGKEKCGVFGAVVRSTEGAGDVEDAQEGTEGAPDGAAAKIAMVVYTGLFNLQHRGQESAGIACDGGDSGFSIYKGMGTVDWVFRKRVPTDKTVKFVTQHIWQGGSHVDIARRLDEWWQEEHDKDTRNIQKRRRGGDLGDSIVRSPLEDMQGIASIGHVRYSTMGESSAKNIHPIEFMFQGNIATLAHNGEVEQANLRALLAERGGYPLIGDTDTELIAALIATSSAETFEDALRETLPLLKGAFSLVFLYGNTVYAANDKNGIRPLCVGETPEYYLVASESCALDGLRAKFWGNVEPGSLIKSTAQGMEICSWASDAAWRSCVFEFIYFSRPDSIWRDVRMYFARKSMGRELAHEHPLWDADIIIPVLDSGMPAALGYAEEIQKRFPWWRKLWRLLKGKKWLPQYEHGLIRSHFIGRTFMRPIESERTLLQYLKHSGIPELIRGKIVVVVDDSIVRGNASQAVVDILRYFGARKVFVLVSSPPIRHSCHLGVDMHAQEDFAAYDKSIEDVRVAIGADYLGYLSPEGLYRAIGLPRATFCDGCFTGEYPVAPETKGVEVAIS